MNQVIMAIIPHADDAASFCGGTLAKFADEGWKIILVRVTNDDKDSMDLPSIEATELANTEQFHRAADILHVSEIVELGYITDTLADSSMVELRERIVYLIRKYRPYAVFSFDPYASYEPNLDHLRVAQAVEEAFWVSNFHLHHPEHLKEGFLPHCVCERWYFARVPIDPNYGVDITPYFDQKIDAFCAHDAMVRNTLHQMLLQLNTWGRHVPAIDAALTGDVHPIVSEFLQQVAARSAKQYGMPDGRLAEVFRVNRFGAMEEFFQATSVPLPGESNEMYTRSCFDPDQGPRLIN